MSTILAANISRRTFLTSSGGAAAGLVLLPTTLLLTGCGSLADDLNLIIAGADAVIPFIPNIPAAAVPIIEAYLNAAAGGVEATAAELASTDSGLVKGEKIGAIWLVIVEPDLSKLGVTGQAAQKILALVNAILAFLQKLGAPTGTTVTAAAMAVKAHAASSPDASSTKPLISTSERDDTIAKAEAIKTKIAALRH